MNKLAPLSLFALAALAPTAAPASEGHYICAPAESHQCLMGSGCETFAAENWLRLDLSSRALLTCTADGCSPWKGATLSKQGAVVRVSFPGQPAYMDIQPTLAFTLVFGGETGEVHVQYGYCRHFAE